MKKVIILSVLLGFTFASQAQTFEDAVQFSRIQNWGTARSAGMAGAFGALGGDLSTLSANPAGIGVFRKSEISITPSLNFANTKATDYSPKDNSFQLGDLGAVFAFYSPNFDWKGINFGINYTNLNNFNRKTDLELLHLFAGRIGRKQRRLSLRRIEFFQQLSGLSMLPDQPERG